MSMLAAIDCGTNSIRLLISSSGVDVVREMRIVRLGAGVDRTGRLDPAAITRTQAALEEYAAMIAAHHVDAVRMAATSATRDAANRGEFEQMVRTVLGIDPEVISGAEEASLSYAGATAGLGGVDWPLLVADIGGGSTELVLGDYAGPDGVRAARSVDIGCVRLTERQLHSDPPTSAEVAAARSDIEAALDLAASVVPMGEAATFVGLAGSVTTVVAAALGLEHYDADRIHLARVPAATAASACAELVAMTRAQRAALPFMHPGRVDVIGGGALVVAAVLARSCCDALVASEHDILDGLVSSLADR